MSRQLMSLREYARHREAAGLTGTTLGAVQKAIKTNRISTIPDEQGRPRIDPAVADIQWAARTDIDQCARGNAPQIAAGRAADPAAMAGAGAGAGAGRGSEPGNASLYWDAKTTREQAEARMAELELAKMEGALADVEGARRAAYESGRLLRDMLMTIPTKLAPELAASTDRATIERRLREELRRPLEFITRLAADHHAERREENGDHHGNV